MNRLDAWIASQHGQLVIGAGLALLGVALGAYLTARFNRQTERERILREDEQRARLALGVRRLVAEELNGLALHLGFIAQQEHGPAAEAMASGHFLSTEEWGRQKGALAESGLRKDVWDGLPPLYHNVELLRARFIAKPKDPLSDDDRARYAEMAEQAGVAANLLGAVGDPTEWS